MSMAAGRQIERDGFGQSLFDDLRFFVRHARLRRRAICWHSPYAEERSWLDEHEVWRRFGDETIGTANVDGLACYVRERIWFGWPDPPQYVVLAFDNTGHIAIAMDFAIWPTAWSKEF